MRNWGFTKPDRYAHFCDLRSALSRFRKCAFRIIRYCELIWRDCKNRTCGFALIHVVTKTSDSESDDATNPPSFARKVDLRISLFESTPYVGVWHLCYLFLIAPRYDASAGRSVRQTIHLMRACQGRKNRISIPRSSFSYINSTTRSKHVANWELYCLPQKLFW